MTLKWVGLVLVSGAFGLGLGVQNATASPESSSALGEPLNVVEDDPYDSWTAIDAQRNSEIAYQSNQTWAVRAQSEPEAESFGDSTLDGIYNFVQKFPVQLDMGGAVIPDILQTEW